MIKRLLVAFLMLVTVTLAPAIAGADDVQPLFPYPDFVPPSFNDINPILYRRTVIIDGVPHTCTYFWDGTVECMPNAAYPGPRRVYPPGEDPGELGGGESDYIFSGPLAFLNY